MPLQNQPFVQPVNGSGKPYPGGRAYYYLTGTVTPADVFTTNDLDVAHSHPIEADANGIFPDIYTDPSIVYRLVLTSADGTGIVNVDPISGIGAVGTGNISDGAVSEVKLGDGAVSARTIGAQQVSNAKLAQMAGMTVKGNASDATAVPDDVAMSDLYEVLVRPMLRGTLTYAAYGASDDAYRLVCNGRSLLQSAYPDLFARIGATWGGDSTHFTLPDGRSYGLVGANPAGGLTRSVPDALTVGQDHADQMLGHVHTGTLGTSDSGGSYPADGSGAGGGFSTGGPSGDGVNGTPRTGLTTHGREIAAVLMIYY